MKKEINYEENIFFIIAQIEQLSQMLKLNLDGNFLSDKFILDIGFFHRTLSLLESSLFEQVHLISLADHLQLLGRARNAFILLLMQIKESSKNLETQIKEKLQDDLEEYLEAQHKSSQVISTKLKQGSYSYYSETESIGNEELMLLLSDDLDTSEPL